jgi:TRAP-type C4-dicarboxylate transport system permease small subunit
MTPTLTAAGRWLRRRAEDVAVLLLMAMFLAFMIQIVFRYVFNWPVGWTSELSVLCWLWVVLWGAAFVTSEKDEIRFDVVYGLLSAEMRQRLTIVTGIAILLIYGMSLPAVTDYVLFMRVERTSYLKIRFDIAYFAYVIFAVATLGRYAWLTWQALRGEAPKTLLDSTQTGPSP